MRISLTEWAAANYSPDCRPCRSSSHPGRREIGGNMTIDKELAEKHWPDLVMKHTIGGACNFQMAANELAEIVASEERKACMNGPTMFITEYLRLNKDGPTIVRLPLSEWPEWAGSLIRIMEAT